MSPPFRLYNFTAELIPEPELLDCRAAHTAAESLQDSYNREDLLGSQVSESVYPVGITKESYG